MKRLEAFLPGLQAATVYREVHFCFCKLANIALHTNVVMANKLPREFIDCQPFKLLSMISRGHKMFNILPFITPVHGSSRYKHMEVRLMSLIKAWALKNVDWKFWSQKGCWNWWWNVQLGYVSCNGQISICSAVFLHDKSCRGKLPILWMHDVDKRSLLIGWQPQNPQEISE